jgi:glycosyltransferase involved in cell wall biosynthesis
MSSSLTLVIPWRDRPELRQTLAANTPIIINKHFKTIVVNCGGDSGVGAITAGVGLDVVVVHLPCPTFNRSLALNIGASVAQSEYLFFIDSDIILSADSLDGYLPLICPQRVLSIMRMRETINEDDNVARLLGLNRVPTIIGDIVQKQSMEVLWTDGTSTCAPSFRSFFRDRSRGGQGQIILAKDAFTSVRGYNSNLKGWGFEDVDILIRLQRVLSLEHIEVGEIIHLSHGDSVRDLQGRTRTESVLRNIAIACANYSKGDLFGTFEADLYRYKDKIRVDHISATKRSDHK